MGAQQLPTEAYALGPQEAEFKARSGGLVGPILLALAGGIFYVPAGYAILKGGRGDNFAVLAFGLVFVAVAARIAVRYLRTERGRRVLVFQDGLVELRPDKSTVFRWDDVEAVRHETTTKWTILRFIPIPTGTSHTYVIRLHSGDELEFAGDVENVTQLGEIIQAEVAKLAAR